ncbi:MAG TPA: D-arabinono-1,4-lactone oxidase [Solirubrobacteraceae bacterium]|nr:D-arabinono-1,4-lactone oxidase [Solirubrobacteraceae bacterium]
MAAADGYEHPANEEELVALVKAAYRKGRRLRVRGAAHSVSHAIYTSAAGRNRVSVQKPPPGDDINVMLDNYGAFVRTDDQRKLVEVQAGIHLGADPSDPAKEATLKRSLLYQLAQKGWSLDSTGGITHQTVSGFTMTGSSGGSLIHTTNTNLYGVRIIDGEGNVHELTRDDADPDLFYSSLPSFGLLGVISTITLECCDLFAIEGNEAVTTLDGCVADVLGPGSGGKPSLEQYLKDTPYSRLEWWPQRGAERIVTWEAIRTPVPPDFKPHPYTRFPGSPEGAQQMISLLFTILGNLNDLGRAKKLLKGNWDQLEAALQAEPVLRELGFVGRVLAEFLSKAAEGGVDVAIDILEVAQTPLRKAVPDFLPKLLGAFIPLDGKNGPQRFTDYGWSGLPMDNAANDELLTTEFTEPWIPLGRTEEVMKLLNRYFTEPKDDHEALRRTGTYAWELYSAMPTPAWMSAAHSSGDDEYKDGVFRVDPYWFADNAENPTTFYGRLWTLLRDHDIPFRLHWGKFHPPVKDYDRTWVDFFRAQYPRWGDFLRLRAERDPNNIFLTDYWRDQLGLWAEPPPSPRQ